MYDSMVGRPLVSIHDALTFLSDLITGLRSDISRRAQVTPRKVPAAAEMALTFNITYGCYPTS